MQFDDLLASQPQLQRNISQAFAARGTTWLAEFPKALQKLVNYWQLRDLQPIANLTWHFVATAAQAQRTVVLKMGCDDKLLQREFRVLKHHQAARMVQALDYSAAYNGLLLQAAHPGITLKSVAQYDVATAYQIYANTIATLQQSLPAEADFPSVAEWCQALAKPTTLIPASYSQCAYKLSQHLMATQSVTYLCHADLHLDNILQHQDTWLMIDPKGIYAEAAFEAAACDLSFDNEVVTTDLLAARSAALATVCQLDVSRLRGWIFVRILLALQWFIEDNLDPQRMLRIAEKFFPLVSA